MPGEFDEVYGPLEESSAAMAEAADAILRGHAALVRAVAAARHAHGERDDLRDTVGRLERLVMDLVNEVRTLRERNGGPAHGGA